MTITAPSPFLSGLRGLNRASTMFGQASERLATGLRINRGADDPAGLIASEFLGAGMAANAGRLRAMDRASFSIMTEDGALGIASRGIEDLQGLVVQGANSGAITDAEFGALRDNAQGVVNGLKRIMSMSGSPALDDVTVEEVVGTDPVTGDDIVEVRTLSDLPELMDRAPELAQELVDEAGAAITERRAEMGARQLSDEAVSRATETEQINLARSRSEIRDADFAFEASAQTRASILTQSSIAVILAKRDADAMVLDLLA